MARSSAVLVGVDTGGTFTDFVGVWPDGDCRIHKRPSTPDDPARAVLAGLEELLGDADADITYGSTVATNAVLERKGAEVVVLTTAGFEDLLEIGRQTRPDIYALQPRKPQPLVGRARRIGVDERMTFDGAALSSLTAAEIDRAVRRVTASRVGSVALCLLHSYANPDHERRLADALRARGVHCSVSSELVAEYREYERLSTTVINAYVAPVMERHLVRLGEGVGNRRLRVLQSSGGATSRETASHEAVRTLLSGPAGGVVGALAAARRIGESKLITLDMGGTSTDVSLVDGAVRRHTEWTIGDLPVKVPAIDIHTVGAGGGSLATIDAGGALKVGPESAGADPGPACYGRGELPTVTDADLVLGRLVEDAFLGGDMRIDRQRAVRALSGLARRLRVSVEAAAEGVVRVVNAGMERAMRTMSVERGLDPRDYVLVCFGGAAGMHACELADALGMRKVLVPTHPGVLSAWGAMRAPVERAHVQTVRLVDPSDAELAAAAAPLRERVIAELAAECPGARCEIEVSVDLRYRGQSYEIEVALGGGLRRRFDEAHRRLYGYADPERAIEAVNLRVAGAVAAPKQREKKQPRRRPRQRPPRQLWWADGWRRARHVERMEMPAGRSLAGPLIITEVSATTVVAPGWRASVAPGGDLILSRGRQGKRNGR